MKFDIITVTHMLLICMHAMWPAICKGQHYSYMYTQKLIAIKVLLLQAREVYTGLQVTWNRIVQWEQTF